MKNVYLFLICLSIAFACGGKKWYTPNLTGTGAPVTCKVGAYSTNAWLNPDPVKQLGAVPVNGQPVLPANKKAGDSQNCDFHIFSWQWFLYLMNPDATAQGLRNFENRKLYPVVDQDTCKSITAKSGSKRKTRGLIPAVLKVIDIPDVPSQAGPGDALYDRNTNIVFYNRSFTVNECGIFANGKFPNAAGVNPGFPTKVNQVVELKSSWKIMGANDVLSRFYTIDANIEGIGAKKLGMVGFHVVVNTGAHPEFVWATFEHVDNAPDCRVVIPTQGYTRPQPAAGWTFASKTCNACIASNYKNGADLTTLCKSQCDFNANATKPVYDAQGNVKINGAPGQTPSNICLDAYYGESPKPQNVSNVPNIQFLNTLLVGPTGILTKLPASNSMAVFKNYFLGGAEWTDVTKITSPTQKFNTEIAGSTYLANSTLESYTQAGAGTFFETGCFSCHGGATQNNTAMASHLLTSAPGKAPGLIDRCDVKAGPILNEAQAKTVCPKVCQNAMGWNGNWNTITGSSTSVCGCNACPIK